MKRMKIMVMGIAAVAMLVATQTRGQEETDANGVPMKLYPEEMRDEIRTNGFISQSVSRFDGEMSPMLLATDPALVPGDKANMVSIQPGTFIMGSPTSEAGRRSNETQHSVTISSRFYIGKYEVTQSEYQEIMGNNPSYFTPANGYDENLNRPVEQVSWNNAVAYCAALTTQEQAAGHIPAGWVYRLPTEAEWEYACRAGTTTAFSFGNSLTGGQINYYDYYNYDIVNGDVFVSNPNSPYLNETTTVGSYAPNAFGIYDMHGNVNEWCQDWYGTYPNNGVFDPQGPATGSTKVLRDGSWASLGSDCRSGARNAGGTSQVDYRMGFRIVLAPTTGVKEAVSVTPPQKVYGNYPVRGSGKNNLVIITHGWGDRSLSPFSPSDPTWVNSMSNAIQTYFDNHGMSDWQVYGYKWVNNSWTWGAPDALYNARGEGVNLGSAVAIQGWSFVHLIGHSAGAELIHEASQWIRAQGTMVHCTFLDPYVGEDKAGVDNYGSGDNWSDCYFSHDVTGDVTERPLVNAYNVDVTQLGPKQGIGKFRSQTTGQMEVCTKTIKYHEWPIDFYMNTITGINVDSGYTGFGFPLSKEGGGWTSGAPNYTRGNGTPGHDESVKRLGQSDPVCANDIQLTAPSWSSLIPDFVNLPSFHSDTGSNQKWVGSLVLHPSSPSWVATAITATNPLNVISFDAQFSGVTGSEDMLSVLWDTNTIGAVDERVVQPGFQHYSLRFDNADANSMHVLSFRLDPYTASKSSVTITNVSLTQIGPSQPFSLSPTTNNVNGLLVWQLTGESGFAYGIQASTNISSTNWTDIAELINTNGTVQFYDQDSTNYPMRFYRAIAPNR